MDPIGAQRIHAAAAICLLFLGAAAYILGTKRTEGSHAADRMLPECAAIASQTRQEPQHIKRPPTHKSIRRSRLKEIEKQYTTTHSLTNISRACKQDAENQEPQKALKAAYVLGAAAYILRNDTQRAEECRAKDHRSGKYSKSHEGRARKILFNVPIGRKKPPKTVLAVNYTKKATKALKWQKLKQWQQEEHSARQYMIAT